MPLDKILFVVDHNAEYNGKQVNNIRINITGNYLVDEFILVHDTVFRIENKGERALQYEVSLSGKEANAHHKLNAAKTMLEKMALQKNTKNSPCPCSSGKKFKVCHGKIFRKLIDDF